jgi:hypothetical protein
VSYKDWNRELKFILYNHSSPQSLVVHLAKAHGTLVEGDCYIHVDIHLPRYVASLPTTMKTSELKLYNKPKLNLPSF